VQGNTGTEATGQVADGVFRLLGLGGRGLPHVQGVTAY